LRSAITVQCAFELCRAVVREGILGRSRDAGGSLRSRLNAKAAATTSAPSNNAFPAIPNEPPPDASQDVTYDRHHFESVFARATDPWSYITPYEQFKYEQTLSLIQERRVARALELACAEGRFTRLLARHVDELLAMDISTVALERAKAACADLPNVHFGQVDFVADLVPQGFDLVVCSEVLYYLGSEDALLKVGAKLRDALTPGGRLILAHTNVANDDPNETGLEWNVPFGGKRIGEVLATLPDLRFARELRTELYRIQVFARAERPTQHVDDTALVAEVIDDAPHVAPDSYLAVRFGRMRERRVSEPGPRTIFTQRVPILMYHDVAPTSENGVRPWRYRLSPSEFLCQLEYLRNAGFRGATLAEWSAAMHYRKRLPDRSVIFTFDDAYRSFAKYAFPLLQKYGFPAIVFVPCAFAGGMNKWDEGVADQVPILDWNEIRQLAADGIEFGAHSMTHPPMTALSNAEVLSEAAQSKAILERELGRPVTAFAYPYGDTDDIVQQLVAQCGYSVGLTTRFERAGFHDHAMALPRVEVTGDDDLATFIRNLGA
jgi:peptidoglycan/xylan/chitin deacetylase (PgdA/CDA1 family)/2-polyprenyl-3-methyl-5-hydroxy-6-metoxy-1,4-benzoquinol methylase